MKEVFVTGADGLVGTRFVEENSKKYKLLTPAISELDILDKSTLLTFAKSKNPKTIVHFAAYTDVGGAESERGDKSGMCWKVNVEGTKNLVEVAKDINAHMVHISTDMVFSGLKEDPGPYEEKKEPEKDPGKVTWYGYTKTEAERVVNQYENSTILRIIYPVRTKYPQKLDYLRKPLKLFKEGKLYPLFDDQQVSVSFIDDIALVLPKIIDGNKLGVFHASSKDTTTPHEIVSYLVSKLGGNEKRVQSSKLAEFQGFKDNPIRYPMFGGLKVEKTQEELEFGFRSWREIVDELVEQGIGK